MILSRYRNSACIHDYRKSPQRFRRARTRAGILFGAVLLLASGGACQRWQPASGESKGEELYRKNCVTCHGINGGGADGPSLIVRRHSSDEIAVKVTSGGIGMPAYSEKLSRDEITAVAEYASALSNPA